MSRLKTVTTRIMELIGGGVRHIRSRTRTVNNISPTHDSGTTNYSYLDKARRGQVRGLEISGLLIKPLSSKIASWAMGKTPKFSGGNKKAGDYLTEWWAKNQAKILSAYEDSLNLADMYIVVNPDQTITVLPPNVVTPIVDEANFSVIIGWETNITYQHPTEYGRTQNIRNEYYATSRVETISTSGQPPVRREYRNFTNKIPVIHVCNNNGSDEMFGRSEWEPLIPMLQKYGSVFEAAIEVNERQGRPTPVISEMGEAKDVNAFWDRFGRSRTIEHPDGTVETEQYIDWDGDQLLTLGGNSKFSYQSPGPFANETSILLGLMFYLLVEHGEIPEGFLGSAIPGSRASLDTQMEPLVKFIEKKRGFAEKWILELVGVVLALEGIIDIQIAKDAPSIKWPDLTNKDGRLTLDAIKMGLETHLLDRATALKLMPLDIDNPEEVLAAAQKEADEDRQRFQDEADRRIEEAERRGAQSDNEDDSSVQPQSAQSARRRVA